MAKLNKIITIACLLVCVFIGNGSATTDLDTDRDGKVDLIYIPDLSSIYQTIMGDDDNYLTDAQLAALLAIDTWAEIEAGIALQNISGAVTDGQVPNNITIDLATTATTANAGDSATAFFSSGTIEDERLPSGLTRDTEAALAYEPLKGADDNYVTDAEKIVIGNTSGTNSGDEIDFSGAGTPGLVPDPTTDDGRLLDTGGWTDTVNADIGGFPSGSIPYADAEGNLQPHPTVDMNELSSLDGAEGNLDDRITALETAGGLDGLSVSVGGESDNTIVATIAGPAHNSLMEVWLSATDGGTYTTAFDGDSAAPWTLSDATAHITRTADVAYQILTGADGDAVVTLKHSAEATKYLCAACAGWVQCGEIAFSADVSPCVYSEVYRAEYIPDDVIKYGGAADIANLCQKIKGSGSPITVCGVKFVVKKDAGVDADFHVELWDDGTDNAGNAKLSTQIGTDSGSVTVTTDGEDEVVIVYFSTPITTDGGDFFVHFINDSSASIYAAAQLFSSPMSYEDSPYDAWRQGTDQGDDINFELMTQ